METSIKYKGKPKHIISTVKAKFAAKTAVNKSFVSEKSIIVSKKASIHGSMT